MIDFDRLAIAPAFLTFGEAATYTPPAGPSASCRVIREGGGKSVNFGPVTVYLSELRFEVRAAEVSAPVDGGVIQVGANSFTITGKPYHPEDDPHGMVWCCNALWGAPLVFRPAATGTPLQGGPFKMAANASVGAATVSIQSQYTNVTGQLRVGDTLGIGAATYTVTAAISPTSSQSLNNIPIAPALAAAAVTGDAVTVVSPAAADYPVRGAIAGYEASMVLGGVQTGDRRIIMLAADLVAAGYTKPPKALDAVLFEGKTFTVMTATAVYRGAAPFAWNLQCR